MGAGRDVADALEGGGGAGADGFGVASYGGVGRQVEDKKDIAVVVVVERWHVRRQLARCCC